VPGVVAPFAAPLSTPLVARIFKKRYLSVGGEVNKDFSQQQIMRKCGADEFKYPKFANLIGDPTKLIYFYASLCTSRDSTDLTLTKKILMRILEVKNWKKAALNRDEWAKFLKKAKAHQGLSSQ
jgi:hypothetical protein